MADEEKLFTMLRQLIKVSKKFELFSMRATIFRWHLHLRNSRVMGVASNRFQRSLASNGIFADSVRFKRKQEFFCYFRVKAGSCRISVFLSFVRMASEFIHWKQRDFKRNWVTRDPLNNANSETGMVHLASKCWAINKLFKFYYLLDLNLAN